MNTADILIDLQHVIVQFGQQEVLRDICLSIPRGQTIAVIGESGCGKTVLLKTVIGLIPPSAGEVWFDGKNIQRLDEKQLTRERLRFGYVFQQAALFDSMTVAQNIAFPLRQQQDPDEKEVRRLVRARLREVGLPETIVGRKPVELSGGMRKRVGLARALIMSPEVLLYDEPTTGLDPIMTDVINQLMLRTRRRHPVTSIVVTHNMDTALKVADRIVMIYPLSRLDEHEPQIIFDGTPDELETCGDARVTQFVRGEAGARLVELGADEDGGR